MEPILKWFFNFLILLLKIEKLFTKIRKIDILTNKQQMESLDCGSCKEKIINTCIYSCGHTFCDNCAIHMQKCPKCDKGNRTNIRNFDLENIQNTINHDFVHLGKYICSKHPRYEIESLCL